MSTAPEPALSLDQLIRRSLHSATAQRDRLHALALRLTIAALSLSALGTFLAGLAGVAGKPAVAGDWRATCTVAAALTLAGTLVTGVQTLLARPERLAAASECVGKLRALMLDVLAPGCDWEAVRRRYQQILVDHAGLDV
jgi:cytochrome c biogenesis factor